MSPCVARRLRLHLFTGFRRSRGYGLQYSTQSSVLRAAKRDGEQKKDYEKRVQQLEAHRPLAECYPRLGPRARERVSIEDFIYGYTQTVPKANDTDTDAIVTIAGRVQSVRTAGSKLAFLDLKHDGHTVQAVCKPSEMSIDPEEFRSLTRIARKGDWYEVSGYPHRSASSEFSVLAVAIPQLLSPSLHQIPETLSDPETRARRRHVDMLVNPEALQPLRVRHLVEKYLNDYLIQQGFIKVNTPILSAGAGGAVARPFETHATEFETLPLNLRIAPELWLKRLVVGGADKVYEIGPAFRNEGVDATHNPEFQICEFYEAYATLGGLIAKTESLVANMAGWLDDLRIMDHKLGWLPQPEVDFTAPYKRLEFIPTLEHELGHSLPDLESANVSNELQAILQKRSIQPPSQATVPRLLDALASHVIEPLCKDPTFITHHPACLSPLSIHFRCPNTSQIVAARAELFIKGREYANMYEEENSPFRQRQKFQDQLKYRAVDGEGDGKIAVDESYLEALEWGMPPTGGWGCGIDRFVMLFAGRDRMADVLPFGSLTNVVGLGRRNAPSH